jgi:hypothetical protein
MVCTGGDTTSNSKGSSIARVTATHRLIQVISWISICPKFLNYTCSKNKEITFCSTIIPYRRVSNSLANNHNFLLNHIRGDSPCVINIVKTNRLRYAGHMIKRPEDLQQKAIFIARPQGTRRQGIPKSRWADRVNSDSRALEAPDWTNPGK